MPDEIGKRVGKLEQRLYQHLAVIHEFIDELREDRVAMNKKLYLYEIMIAELVRMNGNVLQLIDAMDAK